MKKAISLFLVLVLCLGLCACGASDLDRAYDDLYDAQRTLDELTDHYEEAHDKLERTKELLEDLGY